MSCLQSLSARDTTMTTSLWKSFIRGRRYSWMTLHLSLIRCWIQTHSALIGRSGGTSSAELDPELRKHTLARIICTLVALSGRQARAHSQLCCISVRKQRLLVYLRVSGRWRLIFGIYAHERWTHRSPPTNLLRLLLLSERRQTHLSVNIWVTLALSGLSFGRELLLEASEEDLFCKKHLCFVFPEVDRRLVKFCQWDAETHQQQVRTPMASACANVNLHTRYPFIEIKRVKAGYFFLIALIIVLLLD